MRGGARTNRGKLSSRFMDYLCAFAAQHYLKKPDVAELLKVKFTTPRSAFCAAMNELYFRLGLERGYKLTTVNVEITNACNIKCKMCPAAQGMAREKGFIDFDLYKKIIDENRQLDFILPFQWGEPLLHKDLFKMINYARGRGIRTMITTNGTLLNEETIEGLVSCGLARVTFSVDGSPETHSRLRGYPYERLKKNILALKEARDRSGSELKIDISMVVFDETEKDVDFYFGEWVGQADRVQLIPKFVLGTRQNPCRELWRGTLVVLWDGRVSICCADYDGLAIVGDARKEKLADIWNGPAMRELRRCHARRKFPGICKDCGEYNSPLVSPRFR